MLSRITLDNLSNNLSSNEKDIIKYSKLRDEFEIKGGYQFDEKINKIKNGFKLSDTLLNTEYNKLSGGEKTIINFQMDDVGDVGSIDDGVEVNAEIVINNLMKS